MKCLILFSLFSLLTAQINFQFYGYDLMAKQRNWPDSYEAFEAYTGYCKDTSSAAPSMLPELTSDDCKTRFGMTDDDISCTITTAQMSETTSPETSTIASTPESKVATTPISIESETAHTSYNNRKTHLASSEETTTTDIPVSDTKTMSTQRTTITSSALITEDNTHLSPMPETAPQTKSFTSSINEVITTTQVVPLKTSVETNEASQVHTSTTDFDVSSSVKSTSLTESFSTGASTEKQKNTATTLISADPSPSSTVKELSSQKPASPTTHQKTPLLTKSLTSEKSTKSVVTESVSTKSYEFTSATHFLNTYKTSIASKNEQSTANPTTTSTNKGTIKASNFAITKYTSEEDKKFTLIYTALNTHLSSYTPSPISSATSTNRRSTVSLTRKNDIPSFTTITSASVFTTTEMPSTRTTQNSPSSTATKATEPNTDKNHRTNLPIEITEAQSFTVTSKPSETQKPLIPFATTSQYPVDYTTPAEPSAITSTRTDSVSTTAISTRPTLKIPTTKMDETKSTEEPTTVAPTTSTISNVIDGSTNIETQMLPETTSAKLTFTESELLTSSASYTTPSATTSLTTSKTSTAAKTTMPLETTLTAMKTDVKETTENVKTTRKMFEETFTAFEFSISKIQTTTTEDKATTASETKTQRVTQLLATPKMTESQTSPKPITQDATVYTITPITTTPANDVKQSTVAETKPSDLIKRTNMPTSTEKTPETSTSKVVDAETKTTGSTLVEIPPTAQISTTQAPTITPSPSTSTSKSTTSSPSTTKKSSPKSTTKTASSTTPSPSCKTACRFGFYEGEFACYKFIQPKKAEGWKYKDFEATCNSFNGVIATFNDFGFTKNMQLFKRIVKSKKMQVSLVYTNAILTKYYTRTSMVPTINFLKMNATNVQIIGLSSRKTHPNVSAVCRVGKFCEEYTCPIREYFMSETARYLATNVSSTTILKSGQSLNIQCFGTPQRTIQAKCDPRGFLVPDSSLIPCEKPEIQFEADGIVESCGECSENQTTSCQDLKNGSFYCNCSDMYFGKTCKYFNNACENVLCQNGGTCVNEYSSAYCHCQSSYFGTFCQYDFYATDGIAWTMRAIANAAVVVVIVEEVVRQRQKYFMPPSGKHGTLPTEVCRFYATMMGSVAFFFKCWYEFPESSKMSDKYACQTHFEFTIFFCFLALGGMLMEAVIALGVMKNTLTNQFKGRRKNRRNCVHLAKLFLLILALGLLPTVIIWQYSGDLVTPHSCIGALPWGNATPAQQFAALILIFFMSLYALTASAFGLYARNFIDHNNFATRRRYDAEVADPFAYGREILPIENNVRYYLLALRPVFFVATWFAFIASTELMETYTTVIATVISTIYSVINIAQNTIAFKDLESLYYKLMKNLPKSYAPSMNKLTLHCREDFLKIFKPKKLAEEAEEMEKARDEYLLAVRYASCTRSEYFVIERADWISAQIIHYPIQYNQQIDILLMEDRNGWLNDSALRQMFPAGLKAIIQKQWTLVYLKARAVGRPRSEAMAVLWQELQPPRLNRYGYRRSIFVDMFKIFWRNMVVYDQLRTDLVAHRQFARRVFRIGVKMLEIKPYKRFQRAEILDPENSNGGTIIYQRNDPLMNIDQQQAAFDKLEKLCHSISYQMMWEDEAQSRALVAANPALYNIHRDVLNEMVFNNYPWSLLDFMLDERRPNFVGPRTFWNLLAPGIDKLTHTAYYWRLSNIETWRRIRTRAQHLAFAIQIRKDYNEIQANRRWNWWFWNNPNENVEVLEHPRNPANAPPPPDNNDDDLHVEDPIGLN